MSVKNRTRRLLFFYGAVFIASLFVHAVVNKPLLLDRDESHLLKRTVAVMHGERPLLDFREYTYPPGIYWLTAAFFRLFGASLAVERAAMTLFRALASVALLAAGRRVLPRGWSLFPLFFHWAVSGLSFRAPFTLLLLAATLIIGSALDRPSRPRLAAAGLAAGIMLWIRQDIGLFFLAGLAGGLVLAGLRAGRGAGKKTSFSLLAVLAGAAAGFLPVLAAAVPAPSIRRFLWEMFLNTPKRWMTTKSLEMESFPSPGQIFGRPWNWTALILWTAVALLLAVAVLLAVRFRDRRPGAAGWTALYPAWFMGLAFFYQAVQSPNFGALTQNPLLFGLLAPALAAASWRGLGRRPGWAALRAAGGLLPAAAAVAFAAVGIARFSFNERLPAPFQKGQIMVLRPDLWLVRDHVQQDFQGLINALAAEPPGRKRVLILESTLLVFSGEGAELIGPGLRPKPYVPAVFVREARRTRPEYVAVDTWALSLLRELPDGFAAEFESAYEPRGEAGGVFLFRRRSGRAARSET